MAYGNFAFLTGGRLTYHLEVNGGIVTIWHGQKVGADIVLNRRPNGPNWMDEHHQRIMDAIDELRNVIIDVGGKS